MKKFCFLVGLLMIPALHFAQNTDSRYIEVTVSDTLRIVPDVVEFAIDLRNETVYAETYETDSYGADNPDFQAEAKKHEEEEKLKLKMTEKRFTELLSKEKIAYTRADKNANDPMSIYLPQPVASLKPFVLRFNSVEKLAQFREKIPEDIQYDGRISRLECTKKAQMEEVLLERLMGKAKNQAQRLAAVSGVKLGHLMQFSDNTENNIVKGIEDLIISFMGKYEREKFYDNFQNLMLSKTVRVRFVIE